MQVGHFFTYVVGEKRGNGNLFSFVELKKDGVGKETSKRIRNGAGLLGISK